MNTVTINFIECEPAPNIGYRLTWRVAGTSDAYTDEGIFTSSPAVFVDNINPVGTCYEGFLQSDCSESGESGTVLGEAIPWNTPCEDSGTTYTITLTAPCSGIASNYLIEGGVAGDIVTVRATFSGMMAKIGGDFVRADLSISSANGTSDSQQSSCYSDSSPHGFSVTVDSIITMPGATAVVNLSAVVHNSSDSMSSVTVTIIDVNGDPVSIWTAGCKGNSSTGGTC